MLPDHALTSAMKVPLTAQRGTCGVTLLPRDKVIVTAGGRFLVLTEREAGDVREALNDLHRQLLEDAA